MQAVGEGEIDDAINAAKRHRRGRAPGRQRLERLAITDGEDHRECVVEVGDQHK
jgi:hypothetical protein